MPDKIKDFPFKIGADPEFNVLLQDKRVSAKQLMHTIFKNPNEKTCKSTIKLHNAGYDIDKAGQIGWDGADSTGELRPKAEKSPEKLLQNLRIILTAFVDYSKIFELSTRSDKAPVGGHIHHELPVNVIGDIKAIKEIHKKMSSFYLPLMLGEDIINIRMRMRNNFGQINSYKHSGSSTGKTYEFRLPTAEWLITEKIARATLAYTGTVFNEIINHPESFDKCKDIVFKSDRQGNALQEVALSRFTALTKMIIIKIKKHIKEFEFYPQYKAEIDYIMTPSKVLKDKKKANFDIIEGWNLAKRKQPTKKDLMNDKKVSEMTKTIDIETLSEIISINFNKDLRVEEFAQAMKERIISLNWKLQNKYYLFGLKKGIKGFINFNKNFDFLHGHEIVKTYEDLNAIHDTYKKMNNKFATSTGSTNPINKTEGAKYIMIGIPYDIRFDRKYKELIKIIYEIEKTTDKPKTIKRNDLFNDSDLVQVAKIQDMSLKEDELNQVGKLYQILMLNQPLTNASMRAQDQESEQEAATIALEIEDEEREERGEDRQNISPIEDTVSAANNYNPFGGTSINSSKALLEFNGEQTHFERWLSQIHRTH